MVLAAKEVQDGTVVASGEEVGQNVGQKAWVVVCLSHGTSAVKKAQQTGLRFGYS